MTETPQTNFCPACGGGLRASLKFCSHCGQNLALDAPILWAEPAAEPEPIPVAEPAPIAEPEPPAPVLVLPVLEETELMPEPEPSTACPSCGKDLREGAKFCDGCGVNLAFIAPVQPEPPAYVAPPAPSQNLCPACGAQARPGVRFCPKCGALCNATMAQQAFAPPLAKMQHKSNKHLAVLIPAGIVGVALVALCAVFVLPRMFQRDVLPFGGATTEQITAAAYVTVENNAGREDVVAASQTAASNAATTQDANPTMPVASSASAATTIAPTTKQTTIKSTTQATTQTTTTLKPTTTTTTTTTKSTTTTRATTTTTRETTTTAGYRIESVNFKKKSQTVRYSTNALFTISPHPPYSVPYSEAPSLIFELESSDPSIATVKSTVTINTYGGIDQSPIIQINVISVGTCTITVWYRDDPSIRDTMELIVIEPYS